MTKICIINIGGCVERCLDRNRICGYLTKNGYLITDKPKDADVIIVVTCAVFNEVAEYALKIIKKFQKYKAKLIVGGCLPDIEKEKLLEVFNGETLPTKEINQKIEILFPPKNNVRYNQVDDANDIVENSFQEEATDFLKKSSEKSQKTNIVKQKIRKYMLKNMFGTQSITYQYFVEKKRLYHMRISWGCVGNCSYCATKKAIGKFKSKPLNQCIEEFKKGLKMGYDTFVICSDDPGAYGVDINTKLPRLLDEMTRIKGEYSILFTGLSPVMLTKHIDDLEKIIKRKKIKAILIPIQSGSSRILKLMHRYSNVGKIKNAFLRLKKAYPDLILETQLIFGFPSETREDIEHTLNFIEECDLYSGYIYKFSNRENTDAEKIEPKIDPKIISKRLKYAKKYLKKKGYKMYHFNYGISKGIYIFHLD